MNKDILKSAVSKIKASDNFKEIAMAKLSKRRPPGTAVRKLAYFGVPAAALIIAISLISGIFSTPVIDTQAADLMQNITKNTEQPIENITDEYVKSNMDFSIELFKKVAADRKNKNKNLLISPPSVYFALGLTLNGANSKTKTIMEKCLGKYGLTVDDINKNNKAYMHQLLEERGSTILNIANSIWYENKFNANHDFLQTNADYYDASAYKLDFRAKNTPDIINKWVDKNNEPPY